MDDFPRGNLNIRKVYGFSIIKKQQMSIILAKCQGKEISILCVMSSLFHNQHFFFFSESTDLLLTFMILWIAWVSDHATVARKSLGIEYKQMNGNPCTFREP